MAFDVLVHITEDSRRGHIIRKIAEQQHATPEQVVEQVIDAGIDAHTRRLNDLASKNPAEMLLGLFSRPEDAALMDDVTAIAYRGRHTASTRDIG